MSAWPTATEEVAELGELVREKRLRYGLSLRETGRITGVPFSTITRLEHGKAPSFASFVRIARWLELEFK